jgi:IS5 family transposase
MAMMGDRRVDQAALFYEFSLDGHVPADHMLRSIDRFVDLDCIRSERRLCEEVHLNLAYRWFCRLGLDGDVPDHSTFSKTRHGRFRDCDLLRQLFETVVDRCMTEGLVGGEGFAADASLIKADANRQRCVPGAGGLPPEAASRAIEEYLAVLDDAAFGGATPVVPKFLSPADPAARWTGADKGPAYFAYSTNYLIDLDHAVIVDVEATTAIRQAEVGAVRTMIERVAERHDLQPARLAADTAYGSAEMLDWLVNKRRIAPHIPVIDKSGRDDGTFARSDFTYDPGADSYRCPAGKTLKRNRRAFREPRPNAPPDDTYRYRAAKADCDACPMKDRCSPNTPARKVTRSIYEGARDLAREIAKTDAYVTSRRERKKVEMLFAHLKRILRLDRLRLRGPNGARDEFHLAATAQNLRKLTKLVPPPSPAAA